MTGGILFNELIEDIEDIPPLDCATADIGVMDAWESDLAWPTGRYRGVKFKDGIAKLDSIGLAIADWDWAMELWKPDEEELWEGALGEDSAKTLDAVYGLLNINPRREDTKLESSFEYFRFGLFAET